MKRIHLFLVGILFLLCLVPLSQACSDDSPEIPVPPTPENPDPPTATWKNITAAPDNWDGTKRADISYQLLVYSFADKDVTNTATSTDSLTSWITSTASE